MGLINWYRNSRFRMTLEYITITQYHHLKSIIKKEFDEATQDYNARNFFFYLSFVAGILRLWIIFTICLLAVFFFWMRAIRRSGIDIADFRKRYHVRIRMERKKRVLESQKKVEEEKNGGLET